MKIKPLPIVLFILTIDMLLKWWVANNLPVISPYMSVFPYGGIGVFNDFFGVQFSIVHATNTGAAWSIFSTFPKLLTAVRLLFVVILIIWAAFFNRVKKRIFPLTLIVAGAIGNIIDMFYFGHVVDMFFFIFWGYPYPIFNIADISIFLGVLMLLIQSIRKESKAVA